jgi:hypothetical protein
MRIEIKAVDPCNASPAWEWLPDGALKVKVPDWGGQVGFERLLGLQGILEALSCEATEKVTSELADALKLDLSAYKKWVENAGKEVSGAHPPMPDIVRDGSRFWAELHMFALRNDRKPRATHNWFVAWYEDIPFDGCPCKEHADAWLNVNPPDYLALFDWSVKFHNAVNERIGRPVIAPEDARRLWSSRLF